MKSPKIIDLYKDLQDEIRDDYLRGALLVLGKKGVPPFVFMATHIKEAITGHYWAPVTISVDISSADDEDDYSLMLWDHFLYAVSPNR